MLAPMRDVFGEVVDDSNNTAGRGVRHGLRYDAP